MFTSPNELEDYYHDDDEDGLGYYSDGEKRTLTDEQIQMFRPSEIQTILRRRRLELENAEADGEDAPDAVIASQVEKIPQVTREAAQTSMQQSQDTTPSKVVGLPDASPSPKRKWDDFIDDSEANPEALTHRRIAREMDEVKAERTDLMYGDDEPAPPRPARKMSKSAPKSQKG